MISATGWARGSSFALLLHVTGGLAASAPAAPVAVHQSSARNFASVIEQRSSIVAIDRSQTVTQGSTTVTEIVRIGPDPAPVAVSQAGQINRAVVFQQGTDPRLSLHQTGASNVSRTVQREFP